MEAVTVVIGDGPDSRPVVLVTGATGGLGSRVVALLLQKGLRVRALVRNVPKATAMLKSLPCASGARLELVASDLSQPATLRPELFVGVQSCISCAAANIRPKAGDADEVQAKCVHLRTTFKMPYTICQRSTMLKVT